MKSHNAEWRSILHAYLDALSQVSAAVKDARADLTDRGVDDSAIDAMAALSERLGSRVEALLAVFDNEAQPKPKAH